MLDLLRGSRYPASLAQVGGGRVAWSQVELVGGASDPGRSLVQDVGVDLRRADVAGAEELLHRADVAAGLEQVRGEGVPQSVRILLMNPPVFEFATATIPSSRPRSI
jgi:hypothetical protein